MIGDFPCNRQINLEIVTKPMKLADLKNQRGESEGYVTYLSDTIQFPADWPRTKDYSRLCTTAVSMALVYDFFREDMAALLEKIFRIGYFFGRCPKEAPMAVHSSTPGVSGTPEAGGGYTLTVLRDRNKKLSVQFTGSKTIVPEGTRVICFIPTDDSSQTTGNFYRRLHEVFFDPRLENSDNDETVANFTKLIRQGEVLGKRYWKSKTK